MYTRKRIFQLAALALVGVTTIVIAGCGANVRDLEGVPIVEPQKVEIYVNLDGHPNIVRMCIDGVAVMTTTRDLNAVQLVPAWDGWCAR